MTGVPSPAGLTFQDWVNAVRREYPTTDLPPATPEKDFIAWFNRATEQLAPLRVDVPIARSYKTWREAAEAFVRATQ